MHHAIKTTDFDMTPEVASYLDSKLVSLDKYIHRDDESVKCDVELERTTEHHNSGSIYRAEINLSIGGTLFRAESTEETMNAAIDEAKDEMVKQLRRFKSKRMTLLKRGGEKIKGFLKFGRQ